MLTEKSTEIERIRDTDRAGDLGYRHARLFEQLLRGVDPQRGYVFLRRDATALAEECAQPTDADEFSRGELGHSKLSVEAAMNSRDHAVDAVVGALQRRVRILLEARDVDAEFD